MREYEMEVLEKYEFEVNSTRRIRGAFYCDTKRRDDASERDKDLGEARPFIVSYFKPIRKAGISGGYTCVQ